MEEETNDKEVNSVEENEEEMLKRHRQEKKELQAKSQGMRKSIPKGDKKKKKEITEQVLAMEMEMEQRHKMELENLAESERKSTEENSVADKKEILNETPETEEVKQVKVSKAQKRRDKKLQKEQERNEAIAKAEIENMSGKRYIENKKISDKLEARRLAIHEIPADGSCLYFAVMDQLRQRNIKTDVPTLRKKTGEYIRVNKNEFLPYLCDSKTGDQYTEAQFQKYCDDVVKTAAWGGHLELRALSDVLKTPIEVVQSEVDSLLIGEDHRQDRKPIVLTYHRHAYRVGEHYNSVQPLREV